MNKKLEFFWFMPTHGDGRKLGIVEKERSSFKYYSQIAYALDHLGYDGVLIPTGNMFDESWVIASALAVNTVNLKYLIAVRPSVISPVYLARQTSALAEISGQRIAINIVVGGNQEELYSNGVFLSPSERYKQAAEFMEIYTQTISKHPKNINGNYYKIKANSFSFTPKNNINLSVYSSGESEEGKEFAAQHADTYLMWANTPDKIGETIKEMQEKAKKFNKQLRFGIRLHIIIKDSIDLAWKEADYLLSNIPKSHQELAIERILKEQAVAQRNIFKNHLGQHDRLEISPNLWAGVGLARGGALTALVGDKEIIIERINEYRKLGIDVIIASGTPHLDESYNIAHHLFPDIKK
jgi:alkanesulfonate monooxygenase